jgi:hypothetical protein
MKVLFDLNLPLKIYAGAGHWCFTSVIVATWEAEIWRIMIQGQQIVYETPFSK